MMQSRTMSAVEAVVGTLSGLLLGFTMNLYLLPVFGFMVTAWQSIWLTLLFTGAGMARTYIVRRIFNLWR